MTSSDRLLDFFRREISAEEHAGFALLSRIPDSRIPVTLHYYRSLGEEDRRSFKECCALWACASYAFVVNAPQIDHSKHPFFERWRNRWNHYSAVRWNVPLLRAAVQQYKIDAHRGVRSSVSEDEFKLASSIRSIKAPELRKRVRATLKPLGYHKLDALGYYHCRHEGQDFLVFVDYGGRSAQLRYSVAMPEFRDVHPLSQFRFERALGFGTGDWDFIVEENVDDVMATFADVICYCITLPSRIRAELT